MFIFKKFQKQNSDQSSSNNGQSSRRGGGVQPMDQHLQRKFARGIQYNSWSFFCCLFQCNFIE